MTLKFWKGTVFLPNGDINFVFRSACSTFAERFNEFGVLPCEKGAENIPIGSEPDNTGVENIY